MTAPAISRATISKCGRYRYWLERKWGPGHPQVFIMLNPSTADAKEDDPTIRRCMGFARREGAGGLIVVNLFGLRATNPQELDDVRDPVGPDNGTNIGLALIGAAATRRPVICAWGANKNASKQADTIHRRADDIGAELKCLGMTKSGAPKHPLYLSSNAPLVAYI